MSDFHFVEGYLFMIILSKFIFSFTFINQIFQALKEIDTFYFQMMFRSDLVQTYQIKISFKAFCFKK
jgi:hypothetical protein